ncbi:alpha/beta fold hydrolase [Microbacterium hominis]|uniref:Alpha/beta fold hydrolase n=1 Tax=Microbacterium hominis TaxID=162426 RepID=A0A7D4Q0Y8_9MICO|nr:alpha/beta fold hydrolase [Microbacterium hominis]QKJ19338.1 alpha/beta fold hydrolase [Microbacterium hominis]
MGNAQAEDGLPPLVERRARIEGVDVFYRESAHASSDPRVIAHLHGFGLSGRYLLPTAELLADEFRTLVPDLPGFGRSARVPGMLDIPDLAHAAASFLDDRGAERATLVGNAMGCPVIVEFAHHYPERIDRAVLVSPAGGYFNRPLTRAVAQLARDAPREPVRLAGVVVPDYVRFGIPSTLRLFRALTRYPTLQRLLELHVPTLVVLGSRDPLLPGAHRVNEVAGRTDTRVLVVLIEGAAHAINFSHPEELAHLIRLFMNDRPIVDHPGWGDVRLYEIHRGANHPPVSS